MTIPDARCIPCFPTNITADETLRHLAAVDGFSAQPGSSLLVTQDTPTLLVGCGDPATLDAATVRNTFATAARRLSHLGAVDVDLAAIDADLLPISARDRAVAEGLTLGAYRFDRHLTRQATRPAWTPTAPSQAWDEGVAIAQAVNNVRDVVNEPANIITPAALADYFVRLGDDAGLTVTVRDRTWLEQAGAGGILAIGRGSTQQPALVEIVHAGAGGPVDLCLVGKGVTFDSGGLSMKEPAAMMRMQYDMAAAPTIAYAMTFLPSIAPSLNVHAFLPLVENMPGPDAGRPGDIVTARNGATIEILNFDFEGRVILADALAFAAEREPRHIIDLATLTYGAPNALGSRTAALFGAGAAITLVTRAAETSAEPVWQLPMPDYLMPTIRSHVADLKNYPYDPLARASTAAMFLREFVPRDASWAHLDIAGPGWTDEGYDLNPVGATGYGVRLLIDLFRLLADNDIDTLEYP